MNKEDDKKPAAKKTAAKKVVAKKVVAKKVAAKPLKAPAKKATTRASVTAGKAAVDAAAKPQPAPAPAQAEPPVDDRVKALADAAAKNTLAINPLIGIRVEDFGGAAQTLFGASMARPDLLLWHWGSYLGQIGQVLAGKSEADVDPKDKRFVDAGWRDSSWRKKLLQAYAVTGEELRRYIDATSLSDRDKQRAQFIGTIYIDAISPSNTLMHPAAWRKAAETKGASLMAGVKNLMHDLQHNGGLPSSVDKRKFKVGENLGMSKGSVVFKSEVLELIQYAPQTEQVYTRPLLISPPQVNKFYAMDLAPEKSLVQFVTKMGVQLFTISWRNPDVAHRDWDISTYVKALDEAVDAVREITGSPDISLWGACSGGMTAATYVGWLAATGQKKVANIVTPVCTLNPEQAMDTALGLFITDESLAATKLAVKTKGVVDGAQLAKVFAWMRPNDLIWNYWVNNYLLGNDPPAFDVLYWNADTTRLPAAFHADLINIICGNGLAKPGAVKVMGQGLDMKKAKVDAYVVAGITDHITPWKSCFPTAVLFGEGSTFTLANAGHLQSIINPPGVPKAYFFTGTVGKHNAESWAAGAARQEGSWWPHWMDWMHERSGKQKPAPQKLGSAKHKAGVAAPGEYVHQT